LLGREPEGGVRNFLNNTERLDLWATVGTAPARIATDDPSGGTAAWRVGPLKENNDGGVRHLQVSGVPQDTPYRASFWVRRVSTTGVLRALNPYGGAKGEYRIPLSDLPDGEWVFITPDSPYLTTNNAFQGHTLNNGGLSFVSSTSDDITVDLAFPQCELGATVTPYQRVGTTALDVTEAGKRDCYYLFGGRLETTFPDMGDDATYIYGSQAGIGESEDVTINGLTELIRPEKNFGMIYYEQPFTADQKALVKQYICQNTPNCDEFDFAGGDQIIDYTDGGIDYRAHIFTSSGNFIANESVDVEYLVVAGCFCTGWGRAGAGAGRRPTPEAAAAQAAC
jgi:hypothetical protein